PPAGSRPTISKSSTAAVRRASPTASRSAVVTTGSNTETASNHAKTNTATGTSTTDTARFSNRSGGRGGDHHDDVAAAHRVAGGDFDLGDRAGDVCVDLVLHLHGFQHHDALARLDGLADLDEHLDDGALHGNGDLSVAGSSGTA